MKFKMKNETYDRLKWLLFVFEPALVSLISGLGTTLGWNTDIIVTIIGLVTTFIGSITLISNKQYHEENDKENE